MVAVAEVFSQALRLHQSGQLAEAERLYTIILQNQPDHSDGLHLAGLLAYQTGRNALAVTLIRKAVAQQSESPLYNANFATVLKASGNLSEAERFSRRAIALMPESAASYFNLSNTLAGRGQHDEALAGYRRTHLIDPAFNEARFKEGTVLAQLGRPGEAVAVLADGLRRQPDSLMFLYQMAVVLWNAGRPEESIAAYRRALAVAPDNGRAWADLGNALMRQGRGGEALQAYRRAMRLMPTDAAVANDGGLLYLRHFALATARDVFRRAIASDPANPLPYNNLSASARNQGHQQEAMVLLRRASALVPGDDKVYGNMLLTMLYQPDADHERIRDAHIEWASRRAPAEPAPPFAASRDGERRLRIGYVSPDFRNHAAAFYLRPLLEAHDRSRFDLVCYAEVANPDGVTETFRALADGWVDTTALSDQAMAERVRADGIDVLVDLAGHTANNRLRAFALRAAPVQVTWFGYGCTTGLPTMDYFLTDHWMVPEGTEHLYVERVWRLPEVMRCYAPPDDAPAVGPLPALGTRRITFASLNSFFKVTPVVVELWARVLRRVPDSTLLVVSQNPAEDIERRFAAHGIGRERLRIVTGHLSMAGFMELHNQIDVALDPFPHTGATTTFHSLWMGVPVVTLKGPHSTQRGSSGILEPLGLSELAADSLDGYLDVAVRLAADIDRLAALRQVLRGRLADSTFLQPRRLVSQLEDAYRAMWRRYCSQA